MLNKALQMYTSGVYAIHNPQTNSIYIGLSTKTYRRLNQHKRQLKQNRHSNKIMQADYNLSKGKDWQYKTLLLCQEDELRYFEQLMINEALKKYRHVYNVVLTPFKEFEIFQQQRKLFYEETLGLPDPTINRISNLI